MPLVAALLSLSLALPATAAPTVPEPESTTAAPPEERVSVQTAVAPPEERGSVPTTAAPPEERESAPMAVAAEERESTPMPAGSPARAVARATTSHRFGVEINPYMLAHTIASARGERGGGDYSTYLTGTLSVALPNSPTEVALPFAVIDYRAADDALYDSDFSLRRVDLQLRRYRKPDRTGLYAGALVRVGHIEGEPYERETGSESERESIGNVAFTRVGAGLVVGLRGLVQIRSLQNRVFWGANLHVGRWLHGEPTALRYLGGPLEDSERTFFNVEFAKVGVRF